MTLNDQIIQLEFNLKMAKEHIAELEAGRKSSSAKARTALQKIKVLAHELRKGCITTQKTIPVKSRVKITPTEPVVAEPVTEPVEEIKPKPAKKPRKSKKTQE